MQSDHELDGHDGPEGARVPWREPVFQVQRERLLRYCQRQTHDRDVAEDLVQETLLEAWRSPRIPSDLDARERWILGVARHVCLRWMRQQSRTAQRHLSLDLSRGGEFAWAEPAATDDVTAELDRTELALLLDRAMALLPAETRRILIERCIEETPQAELAGRLGVSEGAVAVRVHRGKLALRRVLAGELAGEASDYGIIGGDDAGWCETRIWCYRCGSHRLMGQFAPARSELVLRCPVCDTIPDLLTCHHVSHHGLFDGISGFKPAFSRVMTWAHSYYGRGLREGFTPCTHCGRPAPLRRGSPPNVKNIHDGDRHIHVACADCAYPLSTSSITVQVLGHPVASRFYREQSRIRRMPLRDIEYDGQPAHVVGFESVTGTARLEAIVAADTFDVLRIYTRPSAP